MAQGYVYDPSQQISQSFQQAGSSIGNIFSTLVAQKQRDYNLAENAFNNIEALKKNLNIFGQKNVTEKSNALLKEASAAIFKDGKIDYSKMGEIRQKVSDINDLKQGYDLGAKEFERMLQLGVANKDNMVSFEKFYKDLSAKMADENLVKNPQDLQRQMADTYSNNLDVNKMFMKSYLAMNPMEKTARTIDVKDAKGNVIKKVSVQGEMPTGWSLDANGNKIVPPDAADKFLAQLQQSNPELLDMMKKRAGVAGDMLSNQQLVQSYINRIPTSSIQQELKSENQLKAEALQVKEGEFKVSHMNEDYLLNKRIKTAQARQTEAMADLYSAKKDNLGKDKTSKAIQPLKSTVTTVPVAVNGKTQNVKREEVDVPHQFGINLGEMQDKSGKLLGDVKVLSFINQGGQKYAKVIKVKKNQAGELVTRLDDTGNEVKPTLIPLSTARENMFVNAILGEDKNKKTMLSHKLNSMGFNISPENLVTEEESNLQNQQSGLLDVNSWINQ